ncbi:hypothetical protein QP371_06045 [Gardnerella swidsinskii]|uniref:hypothetical protein n=1 Tax=Gardnerella TaxID=2701 RepID=UPI000E685A9E|nr:hypothetical protein [Gardnerella swidsinskii]MDK7093743.1 hypothetical protein [Gardnerella swidsinskii]RIY29981.1 hypothetical protein CJI49_01475 [Bifidobacteriaceae bacterium NR016]
MGNDSSKDELTAEINNAREAYSEIKTLNKYLSKFATIKNKINVSRGASISKLLKNLYWWEIKLKDNVDVDIYRIKYNKILLMPYTFGLTEDDLNTNTSTEIDLKNYEEDDFLGDNRLFDIISKENRKEKYKKAKIHSNNYNVDITTGNFHPHDALKVVIKGKEIKQIMLVRNTKNQSHCGVLYGENNCPKGEEKNFIVLRAGDNKFYYIPKKCIKLVKENEELGKTLIDFLNSIGVE